MFCHGNRLISLDLWMTNSSHLQAQDVLNASRTCLSWYRDIAKQIRRQTQDSELINRFNHSIITGYEVNRSNHRTYNYELVAAASCGYKRCQLNIGQRKLDSNVKGVCDFEHSRIKFQMSLHLIATNQTTFYICTSLSNALNGLL